jgi:Peptidase family S41/N-terminal domain of Peptidase_S41 in eukaryotic IRBP
MSEKIYALLLRLYPSHFREAYGDEALELFRDRARDEKGCFRSLQLWLDLLADLAISVPREYGYVQPELVGASAQYRLAGVPAFHVLQGESPRPGALLLGTALSLVVLSTFWILLGHGAGHAGIGFMASGPSRGNSGFSQHQSSQPTPHDSADATDRDGRELPTMDPAERQRVVHAAVANIRKYYIDRDVAQKMADELLAHEKSGDDDAVTDDEAFANLLTKQMRDVSPDRHLVLIYSQDPLPQNSTGPTVGEPARYREAMKQQNCTFEKVEILPCNIGYLKLNSFPDPTICRSTAMAAMASLNHADAVIFDLRDNRGGEPAMVALMGAYLFDHPEYWYNPRENTTEQSWTRSPVPGNRLADKAVYVLTSRKTLSGAEQFCYDLKMLKRATLVGETTGGAAHSGVFHRIDDHFGMGIPETRPINPFSKTDWAETGVDPDVKVKAADALATAVKLAETKLRKN